MLLWETAVKYPLNRKVFSVSKWAFWGIHLLLKSFISNFHFFKYNLLMWALFVCNCTAGFIMSELNRRAEHICLYYWSGTRSENELFRPVAWEFCHQNGRGQIKVTSTRSSLLRHSSTSQTRTNKQIWKIPTHDLLFYGTFYRIDHAILLYCGQNSCTL